MTEIIDIKIFQNNLKRMHYFSYYYHLSYQKHLEQVNKENIKNYIIFRPIFTENNFKFNK